MSPLLEVPLHFFGGARDLARVHEIASVLVRHGLGDLVHRIGLARLLQRAGRALHWKRVEEAGDLDTPERMRLAFEELGPTFVKLGQVLAGRSDLLGPEWTSAFSRLHEHARPVPVEELRAQLALDLGAEPEQVFDDFDPAPLAAASIAQVHRARLRDGTPVVLKVRRPGIERAIEADLRLLARLAERLERDLPEARRFRPRSVVRQFARSLHSELNLAAEAHHCERLARAMAGRPELVIPRIHGQWTCERLLVQDYLEGLSAAEWLARGRPPLFDAPRLAALGADVVLEMVFVDGFYHADPHPGNVLFLDGGRIGLLDFGMVGRLSEERRREFVRLLAAVVERDEAAVVELLSEWSDEGATDPEMLALDCAAFIDRYHGLELREIDVTALLRDVAQIVRENDLVLPVDVAMLLKLFVTLEGLGRALDPAFEMAAHVEPFARATLRSEAAPLAVLGRGAGELRHVLAELPRDLRRLVGALRRGRLHVDLDLDRLHELSLQVQKSSNRLTVGLVTSALIVGTSISLTVRGGPELLGLPAFASLGFASSLAIGLVLLVSILRSGGRP